MALTRRYQPPHPTGDTAAFGMDFSAVIPEGMGIDVTTAPPKLFTNTQPPLPADADWTVGPFYTRGRAAFVILSGGVAGKDYMLEWQVWDNLGNVWTRTALLLCASTS